MKRLCTLLIWASVVLVAGCEDVRRAEQTLTRRDTSDAVAGADAEAENSKGSPVGPEYKTVDVLREGMRDTMRLRLTGSARGFDPHFYTYAPIDFIFEPFDATLGQGFKFTANFAGQRRSEAFVLIVAYPAGTSEVSARANLATYIAGREVVAAEGKRQSWTIAEETFQGTTHAGDPINGWIGLGRHGNRYFMFATEYPPEFSEGMSVRVDQIMKEWRWLPEGTPLGS